MRSHALVPLVFAALVAACPLGAPSRAFGGGEKNEAPAPATPVDEAVDLGSLEARALAAKLHVPANWRPATRTVDILYAFSEEPHLLDWKLKGHDKAEVSCGLEVSAGSAGTALGLLDAIYLAGDATIEATFTVIHMAPSSDLCILVGVHGNEAIGVRWGDQLVRVKGARISALTKDTTAQDKFAYNKPVDVKVERKGDELTTWVNKMEGARRKLSKKELDGRVGFLLASNVRARISSFRVSGAIDLKKL